MLAALLSLFGSSIGKYVGYGLVILALLGTAYGYVKTKESEAASAAQAAFNQVQLQETLKENQAYQAQIQQLNDYNQSLANQVNVLQGTIESLTQTAQKVVTDQEKTDKVPFDPIFNSMLNSLKGGK